jgi:hypothetical protein
MAGQRFRNRTKHDGAFHREISVRGAEWHGEVLVRAEQSQTSTASATTASYAVSRLDYCARVPVSINNGSGEGRAMGKLIGIVFVAMAAIPICMGAIIFAPVILLLVVLCVWLKA